MKAFRGIAPNSVVGRYSRSGDLAVEGTRAALRILADTLRAAPSSLDLAVPDGTDPQPYDGFLTRLQATTGDARLVIGRDGGTLLVSGNPNDLAILAENIETLGASATGMGDHLHVEYHPDHYYLDASSLPLVVELNGQTDNASE